VQFHFTTSGPYPIAIRTQEKPEIPRAAQAISYLSRIAFYVSSPAMLYLTSLVPELTSSIP